MNFDEIKYKRPSFENFETAFNKLITAFEEAASFAIQDKAFTDINHLFDEFKTMVRIAFISFDKNTKDEKWKQEIDYLNNMLPREINVRNRYYAALGNATFKKELEKKWGDFIFKIASYSLKTLNPSIIEDRKTEMHLTTEYKRLLAGAKIEFEGETLNLSSIGKYAVSKDRNIREKALKAKWNFFESNQKKLDSIFDELVKVRQSIALKLGYENYIKVGYIGMKRMDYNDKMVAGFREEIVEEVVPLVGKLRKQQQERLNYSLMADHDLQVSFANGNPAPIGSAEQTIESARLMYEELNGDIGQFFNFMLKNNLIDYLNRPGKATGGYCSSLFAYEQPFVFMNFNGTLNDVRVLLHETGHAYQFYKSRKYKVLEYRNPSSESAEIHAMSMEMLTYPWMDKFFEEDTKKYIYTHISSRLTFLPYGCAIDHFQHIIYEKPGLSSDERAAEWKKMEKLYLPDRRQDITPYIKGGRFWQRQGHIYKRPFYYIDYVLAQICAFQFLLKSKENKVKAWEDYVRLCEAGGTDSFLNLLKTGDLKSPFDKGVVKKVIEEITSFLDGIDATDF